MSLALDRETLDVLRSCWSDSEQFTVSIPEELGTLERALYEDVDDVLKRLGGKWSKKLRAHQFPYNPTPLVAGVVASGERPPKNPTAFFPTPAPVVELMIECSKLSEFTTGYILEPSAGTGAIARAAQDVAPNATVHCCEILPVNRAVLEGAGFEIVAEDFVSYKPSVQYDCILMNPPFSVDGDALAYITHIEHAWQMLREHGILCAIVPAGWLYGSTKRIKAFREFVCDYLDVAELGVGTFKESGTMVNTYLLYGEKSDAGWRAEPYNGWCSYHAWNASLWIDNEYEWYTAACKAQALEQFTSLCERICTELLKREVPILLRAADIESLWNHYKTG